jgi:hypothetical protein
LSAVTKVTELIKAVVDEVGVSTVIDNGFFTLWDDVGVKGLTLYIKVNNHVYIKVPKQCLLKNIKKHYI